MNWGTLFLALILVPIVWRMWWLETRIERLERRHSISNIEG